MVKGLKFEREYLCLVGRLHPCSIHDPPSEGRYPADRIPDTHLCPSFLRLHSKVFHRESPLSHPGWKLLEFALGGCSKIHVFETATSSKLQEDFPGTLMLILGGDFLQSELLNLVPSWQATQNRRLWLTKLCPFTVNCNCINWETVSSNGKSTRLCHKQDTCLFLAQLWVWLVVIGGEISKMEMAFLFRSADSFFSQSNMNEQNQTA